MRAFGNDALECSLGFLFQVVALSGFEYSEQLGEHTLESKRLGMIRVVASNLAQ